MGGAKHQQVKVEWGVDGTATPVSAANPMPVVQTGTPGLPTGAATAANQQTDALTDTELRATPVPISGTVTSNAGTNLNTSALALETGGNLAAAATSLATLDNIVSGSEAQVDVVAALPAGNNNIGDVDVASLPVAFNTGTRSATTQRVTVATDDVVPVTGTFWQATQPVSGTVTANAGTNLNTSALATSTNLTAGTQKTQIVDGSGNVIGATSNALDINIKSNASSGFISTSNSSTANLAGAAAFTGTGEDVTQYSEMRVSVYSSHVSATDGLSIQQSSDNSNWDITDTYTIAAATGKTFVVPRQARYFRVVYTNGATLTTSFRLQAILNRGSSASSSQRPSDGYTNETDMTQGTAFLMGYNGTTWDRLRSDTTNGLDVDVVRLPALVAGSAAIGKLAANSGVDIGDVDVTTVGTITPGTAATSLGKAEDAGHTTGDVGVFSLGVRNDTLADVTNTTADYSQLSTDLKGRVMTAGAPRSLKGMAQVQLSNTTTETTILAATASTFHDVYGIILANTGATTTKVSIRDDTAGTVRAIIEVPTLETRGFMLPVDSAVPQTAVNKNWTAQCSSATTALEVTLFYVSMV